MPRRSTPARAAQHGFSFIELMVVMGIMAVLMGLAIGFLGSAGRSGQMAQARRLIQETGYRCISASTGARRAFLSLRPGQGEEEGRLVLQAGVARTIVTHQMEELEFASGARAPTVEGSVKIRPHQGRTGSGAWFKGGALVFQPEAIFAPSDGVEIEAWLQPTSRGREMTILRAADMADAPSYVLSLMRDGDSAEYDVRLQLNLLLAGEAGTETALLRSYQTKGAPVHADGQTWVHVAARYDGRQVRIEVGGVEQPIRESRKTRGQDPNAVQRFAPPPSGALSLTISAPTRAFHGMMDSVILRGVFQSVENRHVMPEALSVLHPPLPVVIEYQNGRIVGAGASDVLLWLQNDAFPDDLPLRFVFGRGGSIEYAYTSDSPPRPDPKGRKAPATTPGGGS